MPVAIVYRRKNPPPRPEGSPCPLAPDPPGPASSCTLGLFFLNPKRNKTTGFGGGIIQKTPGSVHFSLRRETATCEIANETQNISRKSQSGAKMAPVEYCSGNSQD